MLYAPTTEYHHAKQTCYLCGRADHLVDTQVIIEGEGVLAICEGCVLDMVRVLTEHSETDVFDASSQSALEQQVKSLQREKRELAKRLRETKVPVKASA